ncbi:protein jag [Pseudodesulfovibrio sp. zrk46]|uniref:Jag family protein n=1 Tax=Pseudodesulfovibrio sp. zrk46 TaxID=2725288 RepID=UPI00144951CE|nr:protein jag [Pseudodesulfovibrio sp. zrk46]QJB55192.1 KH domain-containing protein [Pseudodesulfovibrio sp. zrk46]
MSDFKEFQGKDLDEAIESACDYFNLKRDRLEIEILSGGSSGIFGIMGVKKAKVKARARAQVNATDILNGDEKAKAETKKPREKKAKAEPKKERKPKPAPKAEAPEPGNAIEPGNAAAPEVDYDRLDEEVNGNVMEPEVNLETIDNEINGNVDSAPVEQKKGKRQNKPRDRKPRNNREERPRPERKERKPRERRPQRQEQPREERPRANMDDFDHDLLKASTMEVMTQLLKPIVGDTSIEVTIESDRVKVFIDDEENSGLIIGREGQTLSSLQYLVNRLVSRKMEASIRIQVDTGDYRERQDDKLRQIAEHLADKASDLGRTQSTKPLSSYHRRVVHLALQENEEVFTRSKGDGPMKRVLIVPKSRKNDNRPRR